MADVTKLITTRLTLDGEAEYNNKIKQISSSMGSMKSEMAKLSAEYAGQLNSYDALTKKGDILARQLDTQKQKQSEVARMLKEATDARDRLNESIAKTVKAMEDEAQTGGKNTEKYKELENSLKGQEESAAKAANTIAHFQKELNYADAAVAKANTALDNNGKYLDEASNSADGLATSINGAGKEITKTGTEAESAGEKFKDLGDKGENAISALAGALATAGIAKSIKEITDTLKECADASMDFEQSMSVIQATTGATSDEMGTISDAIRQTALRTGTAVSDLSTSARDLMEVGSDVGLVVEQLASGTDLAIATNTEYGATFDFLSAAMKTFKLDASEAQSVSDSFAYTTVKTNTNLSQLGDAFTNVGGAAVNVGFDINNVNAHLITFAEAGLKGGAAGTTLNGILRNLSAPTGKAAEELERLGVSLYEANGASRDMFAVMSDLETALARQTDAQRNRSQQIIFDNIALKGWNMITAEGVGNIKSLSAEISGSSDAFGGLGQAAGMAGVALDNTQGNLAKMDAAVNDLKISIGNALLPVLNDAYSTGTDLATWAAEFVENNEELVRTIGALVAALGLFVGGIAVAKVAMIAFNAVLAMNPIAAVTIAILALVTALTALVVHIRNADNEFKQLSTTNKELIKSVDASAQAHNNKINSILSETATARKLADQLYELAAAENKSAEDKQRLATMVEVLNSSIDGLNLAYDAENDRLSQNRESIDALIDARHREAMSVAAQERAVEIAREQISVNEQLAQTQEKRAELEEYLNSLSDFQRWNQVGLRKELKSLIEQEESLVTQQEELGASFENVSSIMDDAAEATGALEQANADLEASYQAMMEPIQSIMAELEELEAAYDEAYEAAYNSLDKQMGLWSEMDNKTTISAKTMSDNLQSQITYLDNYSNNMDSLLGRNIDGIEDFAKNFADGSKESAQALAGLADASDEEIEAIIESMKRVEEGKEAWAGEMAALSTDFDTKMNDITNRLNKAIDEFNQSEQARKAGVNTVEGFIQGAESKRAEIIAKAKSLGEAFTEALEKAMEITSPSRVMMRIGGYAVYGFALGIDKAADVAIRAAQNLSKRTIAAIAGEAKDLKDSYDEQRNELEYYHKMGLVSTDEYYKGLKLLRDAYLEENSQAWRSANIELRNMELDERNRQESIMLSQFDDAVKRRQEQIKKELDLEKKRLNTIINNINQEIQARKTLRSDEDAEKKIKDAQRALEVAQAQRDYARDANEMAEFDKLIAQRQKTLDDAINNYEEQLWLRGKQAEIESAKGKMEKADQSAAKRIENAAKTEQAAVLQAVKMSASQAAQAMTISGFSQALIEALTGREIVSKTANINVTNMGSALSSSQITTAVMKALNLL